MSDPKRPKPTDEAAVTRRWSGQDLAETTMMPPLSPPPPPALDEERTRVIRGGPAEARRQTLSMKAVDGPSSTPASGTVEPAPSSTRLPESPATLPPPTVHMAADPVTHETGGGVELTIVEEQQVAGGEKKAWRAAEVWTKRRVYGLDSTFKCVEIIDRETGLPEKGHEMLGARLGGGRQRDKDNKVRFSYPLPLPGMEAMFMKQKKHGYTSAVERMVVRVRVLVTSAEDALPSWDEIGSRWSDPPPKG